MKFIFDPTKCTIPYSELPGKDDRVFIHFTFDKFDVMECTEDLNGEVKFTLHKMVPPGDLVYFFSINGKSGIALDKESNDTTWENRSLDVPQTNIIKNIE